MYQSKPDVTIVVPTYWTWHRDGPSGPVQAVFDHPTPLDGAPPGGVGTLPRLLESLSLMEGPPFSVLVLTATVHPDLFRSPGLSFGKIKLAVYRGEDPGGVLW